MDNPYYTSPILAKQRTLDPLNRKDRYGEVQAIGSPPQMDNLLSP